MGREGAQGSRGAKAGDASGYINLHASRCCLPLLCGWLEPPALRSKRGAWAPPVKLRWGPLKEGREGGGDAGCFPSGGWRKSVSRAGGKGCKVSWRLGRGLCRAAAGGFVSGCTPGASGLWLASCKAGSPGPDQTCTRLGLRVHAGLAASAAGRGSRPVTGLATLTS